MPELPPVCETHGQQGWHELLKAACPACASRLAFALMYSAWVLVGKAKLMAEAGITTGRVQPAQILCPEGHVMMMGEIVPDAEGKMAALRTTCGTRECAHYGVPFRAVLPLIELQPIKEEGGQRQPDEAIDVEGPLKCGCPRDGSKLRCGFTDMCLDHCPCHSGLSSARG